MPDIDFPFYFSQIQTDINEAFRKCYRGPNWNKNDAATILIDTANIFVQKHSNNSYWVRKTKLPRKLKKQYKKQRVLKYDLVYKKQIILDEFD